MVNKTEFSTYTNKRRGGKAVTNEAGGRAIAFSTEHALAQLICTGTTYDTFYSSAESIIEDAIRLANNVDVQFLAKCAVYGRQSAFMKDMPAIMLAVLMKRDADWFERAFYLIADNGKMLRNFINVVRSGKLGSRSFSARAKKLMKEWFRRRDAKQMFRDAIGGDPSVADMIKMVHPRPLKDEQRHLWAYLIGRPYDIKQLPDWLQAFEQYKLDVRAAQEAEKPIPRIPKLVIENVGFERLTALQLPKQAWKDLAKQMGWHALRINLRQLHEKGVFEKADGKDDNHMIDYVVKKLTDEQQIARSKVMPHQLMMAFEYASDLPQPIRVALQQACDMSVKNVPKLPGKTVIGVDTSYSMTSPVTGFRGSASSKAKCIDVAALFGAILVKQGDSTLFSFDIKTKKINCNPLDSVLTIKKTMPAAGGGTQCASVVEKMLVNRLHADQLFIVSDNMSWHEMYSNGRFGKTRLQEALAKYRKEINPDIKVVLMDLQPYGSTQAKDSDTVLNVGGWSDSVFPVIEAFINGYGPDHWLDQIENTQV